MPSRLFGESTRRKEDPKLIAGRGTYVDDVFLPRMSYVTFLRTPYAHALIKNIDASGAARLSGILTVLTGDELAKDVKPIPAPVTNIKVPARYPLAFGKVRYVGEPVAAVVAENRYDARDAVDFIQAEYDPLPPVVDPEEAMKPEAPLLHDDLGSNIAYKSKKEVGDVRAAFEKADKIASAKLIIQRMAHVPIEPRGIVASYEPASGSMTVWLSTQYAHIMRIRLGDYLGIPQNKLRVIAPDVGGSFGCKGSLYSDELTACILSMRLGRPVKWVETRSENLTSTIQARDQIHHVDVAVRNDGTILGIRDRLLTDYGAYFHPYVPAVTELTMMTLTGNYKIRNMLVESIGVFTNKMSLGSLRGAGRAEATFVIETMLDRAARGIGTDPAKLRFKNYIQPRDFPYESATGLRYDSGNYPNALSKALKLSNYWNLLKRGNPTGGRILRGVGIASYVMICGGGPSRDMPENMAGYETATIRFEPSGRLTLLTGTSGHGQGSDTTLAQVAGEQLGLSIEDVDTFHGDTSIVPHGIGTHGSRSAAVGSYAVLLAAKKVVEKAKRIAAILLKTDPERISFSNGRFSVRGSESGGLTIKDIAREAYSMKNLPADSEPGLISTAYYEPRDYDYSFGINVVVVGVDPENGKIAIEKCVSVDDCGRVINPMIVEGQIHGGLAQGIGQALYEEVIYDANGQPLTSTLMDYCIPSAVEIPEFVLTRTVTPSRGELGIKGVGEAGAMASTAAIVNAVNNALADLNIEVLKTPISSEWVWSAIRKATSRRGSNS